MYSIEKDRTAYFMTIRGDKGKVEYCNLHHFMGDFAATFHAIQNLIHYGEKQRYIQNEVVFFIFGKFPTVF